MALTRDEFYGGTPPRFEGFADKQDWYAEQKLRRLERWNVEKKKLQAKRLRYVSAAIACVCFAILLFVQNCFMNTHDYNLQLLYSLFCALVTGLLASAIVFVALACSAGPEE